MAGQNSVFLAARYFAESPPFLVPTGADYCCGDLDVR